SGATPVRQINSGLLPGHATTLQVLLSDSGSRQVQTGTFSVQGFGNVTGSASVTAGATLGFDSGVMFDAGAIYSAARHTGGSGGAVVSFAAGAVVQSMGALALNLGAVDFSTGGAVRVASLNLSGGTLTGSDVVTVTGPLIWTSGAMTGTGTTVAQGGLQLGAA